MINQVTMNPACNYHLSNLRDEAKQVLTILMSSPNDFMFDGVINTSDGNVNILAKGDTVVIRASQPMASADEWIENAIEELDIKPSRVSDSQYAAIFKDAVEHVPDVIKSSALASRRDGIEALLDGIKYVATDMLIQDAEAFSRVVECVRDEMG